jgi:hypothetical protein
MSNPETVKANYRNAIREISVIVNELAQVRVRYGVASLSFGEDAVLAAAVELYKHHNPWVQREYGTEPF